MSSKTITFVAKVNATKDDVDAPAYVAFTVTHEFIEKAQGVIELLSDKRLAGLDEVSFQASANWDLEDEFRVDSTSLVLSPKYHAFEGAGLYAWFSAYSKASQCDIECTAFSLDEVFAGYGAHESGQTVYLESCDETLKLLYEESNESFTEDAPAP